MNGPFTRPDFGSCCNPLLPDLSLVLVKFYEKGGAKLWLLLSGELLGINVDWGNRHTLDSTESLKFDLKCTSSSLHLHKITHFIGKVIDRVNGGEEH